MTQWRRLYIFKVFIEYPLNLGSGCISMFSVNMTFDKTLMNTLIRHEVRQWLGLDRQEDRYVQYEHQKCNKNIKHNIKTQHTKHKLMM